MEEDIKMNCNFICFSDRKKLEKIFKEYCKINNIPESLFNLITFLQIKELLNRKNVKKIVEEI